MLFGRGHTSCEEQHPESRHLHYKLKTSTTDAYTPKDCREGETCCIVAGPEPCMTFLRRSLRRMLTQFFRHPWSCSVSLQTNLQSINTDARSRRPTYPYTRSNRIPLAYKFRAALDHSFAPIRTFPPTAVLFPVPTQGLQLTKHLPYAMVPNRTVKRRHG
ncbi:hypothetical protein CPB85DRAFT_755285 [Mucidula mucida]|nr:hypothetical protein CPB85DRAFT_755285 [Mucidula mucida]